MKVTCVGTDPAGLYLGILLKRRDPSHVVRIIETPGALLPPAIVCNPLKPRLKRDDAETQEEMKHAIAWTDKVTVSTDERLFATDGLRYGFVDPKAVTDVLKRRAAALGCTFVRGDSRTSLE